MTDAYAVMCDGGPASGLHFTPTENGWPLPDMLGSDLEPVNEGERPYPAEPGVYVKVAESQLPNDVDSNPHVMRGARYEWRDGR